MKEPTFNGRVLLSMDVIEAARAGDPLALERVLRYYDRYSNKICTRTLYDKDGLPHIDIDEYMASWWLTPLPACRNGSKAF